VQPRVCRLYAGLTRRALGGIRTPNLLIRSPPDAFVDQLVFCGDLAKTLRKLEVECQSTPEG